MLDVLGFARQAARARILAAEIDRGIQTYGTMTHPTAGRVFAYEVDGFGNQLFMDDANLPSLLSLPYLGYCGVSDPLYVATRRAVLSSANPYFYSGPAGEGVGSPHTGHGYIWPMSIITRGITSTEDDELRRCLSLLINSTACTGLMHESFEQTAADRFTRPWFAWANSFFGEFVLYLAQNKPHLIF